jgi:hypothetical protein
MIVSSRCVDISQPMASNGAILKSPEPTRARRQLTLSVKAVLVVVIKR